MAGTESFPFGYTTVRSCQVPEEWTKNEDENFDWGILIFNSDIGSQAGYLGVNRFTNLEDFKNLRVEISGYPANSYIQYYQEGNLTSATDTIIKFRLDITGGQSGSPIIDKNNGRVVGIVNREDSIIPVSNYGARINTRLLSATQQAVTNNP